MIAWRKRGRGVRCIRRCKIRKSIVNVEDIIQSCECYTDRHHRRCKTVKCHIVT